MNINGVVNLNKEKGYTSQDAIRVLKGIMKADKVGHTGTLDPDATGVLPVCLGKATKIAELITGTEKAYRAEVAFGAETDTQDASGKVLKTFSYTLCEDDVRKACEEMTGEILQIPPMYSALKHNGQKLYDLARKGVEVERQPRPITIHEIRILEIHEDGMTIDVKCSKGTYIRTLCEDIGRKLGYGAHMKSLIRTASGPYKIEDAYTLKEIETMVKEGRTSEFLTDLTVMFEDLPSIRVLENEDLYLRSGNFLTYPSEEVKAEMGDPVRMHLSGGELAALYKVSEYLEIDGKAHTRLRAFKMFV